MRWRVYLLVFGILTLICCNTVAAAVTVIPNPEWIVANGHDSTEIIVSGLDPNVQVHFSVDEPSFGTILPTENSADSGGVAHATFKAGTKSGTAVIIATVNSAQYTGEVYIDHDYPTSIRYLSYPIEERVGNITNITVGLQDAHGNIVDNKRDQEFIKFSIVTLGDTSRFWNETTASYTDLDTTLGNDGNGMTCANISLGIRPGDTLIRIIPPSTVPEKTITISRQANGVPYRMWVSRDPSVNYVPADGSSNFVFTFYLYDEFGNALNNRVLNLTSSATDIGKWGPLLITTITGKAAAAYGPYTPDETFFATVTAFPEENKSLIETFPVEFYDPSPRNVLLTISPVTLQSLDSNSSSYGILTVGIVDMHGKPVPGVSGALSITNVDNGSFIQNISPCLDSLGSGLQTVPFTTGPEGIATMNFYPGGFSPDQYSAKAKCDVKATWGSNTSTVTPEWRNYNYLSVTTTLDRTYLTTGETVNVSVQVAADGPSLTPKPIDLILCSNRGTSMLKDMFWLGNSGDFEDKMVYLYDAGQYLVQQLNTNPLTQDRAGIVSYGSTLSNVFPTGDPGIDGKNDKSQPPYENEDTNYINSHYGARPLSGYEDYATTDEPLNNNTAYIEDQIRSITPYGDKQAKNHVPMRYGIYKSIQELSGDPINGAYGESTYRENSIKAIILLADSEWDDFGDPTAGWDGTKVANNQGYYTWERDPEKCSEGGLSLWTAFYQFDGQGTRDNPVSKSDYRQNLAKYAKEHGIYIFPVAYFNKGTSVPHSLETTLKYMATETGGDYYVADCGQNLSEIFDKISKRLRKEASVNTKATLNFTKVKVGTEIFNGSEAFDYVGPIEDQSTFVKKWNQSSPPPIYAYTRDDNQNWTDYQILEFSLGTMYLGDRWLANFTLLSKKTGTVEILGEGSGITFESGSDDGSEGGSGSSEEITVPGAFPYFQPMKFGDTPTEDLYITSNSRDDDLNFDYGIYYTGNKTVHVKLYYRKLGSVMGKWTQFASINHQCPDGNCENIEGNTQLSKWKLGPGNYEFKIEAYASDSSMDSAPFDPYEIIRIFYIWLR